MKIEGIRISLTKPGSQISKNALSNGMVYVFHECKFMESSLEIYCINDFSPLNPFRLRAPLICVWFSYRSCCFRWDEEAIQKVWMDYLHHTPCVDMVFFCPRRLLTSLQYRVVGRVPGFSRGDPFSARQSRQSSPVFGLRGLGISQKVSTEVNTPSARTVQNYQLPI